MHPTPISNEWIEIDSFHEALRLHMARHQESYVVLQRALAQVGIKIDPATIKIWASGLKLPRNVKSLEALARIEQRYSLPKGYFSAKIPSSGRAASRPRLRNVEPAEQRRLAWHLPDDFGKRSKAQQEEILAWIRNVVVSGATEYRRYQAEATKHSYGIRFPTLTGKKSRRAPTANDGVAADLHRVSVDAPPQLAGEMAELVRFKSATLTDIGFQRSGVWGEETASQKIEHLGLMFGALAAAPGGSVAGRGIPLSHLSFAMLLFPRVWDWYVQWRERRRGFYNRWEVEMLRLGMALTREGTGWLRQQPQLADRLLAVEGLISELDISEVRADWAAACDLVHAHAAARSKEIERVARVHRDPFEPILSVLEADSPVAEYRKIADEILRRAPSPDCYPRAAAEASRSILLIRLGLHLGLRQKNLRQLMVCPRNQLPRSELQLEKLKRGEIRWSERHHGWEVLIPAVAFKNADSSFFAGRPFRLVLPDLGGLYSHIVDYIQRHRRVLLNGAEDPGTFFVKTVKTSSRIAEFDQNTFYEAWRHVTQRYGVYNPYTGRGAIKGLLPHGPHSIRDVLATHVLKQTGSYEQASYAIQDTPEMVAKHYGRFLPQDKSALVAEILNRVWEAA
ncbi:MAG: hypothetical protein ABW184_15935 [Sphingobium sp.]